MSEQRFRRIWKAICATWKVNKHCLVYGCGRYTMYNWVKESDPFIGKLAIWEVRHALELACKKGWAKKGKCGNYTTFKIHC